MIQEPQVTTRLVSKPSKTSIGIPLRTRQLTIQRTQRQAHPPQLLALLRIHESQISYRRHRNQDRSRRRFPEQSVDRMNQMFVDRETIQALVISRCPPEYSSHYGYECILRRGEYARFYQRLCQPDENSRKDEIDNDVEGEKRDRNEDGRAYAALVVVRGDTLHVIP